MDALPTNYKSSIPVLTRTGSDVTKTTMVNIVPISAYSRPLSLHKNKRSIPKFKSDSNKKKVKIIKQKNSNKEETSHKTITDPKNHGRDVLAKKDNTVESKLASEPSNETIFDAVNITVPEKNNSNDTTKKDEVLNTKNCNNQVPADHAVKEISLKTTSVQQIINECNDKNETPKTKEHLSISIQPSTERSVEQKNTLDKEIIDKDKQDKLPPILETSLCENTVDGGNARLELAEEFLAASPTAAFLMSFPLVSGNRADSPADETHSSSQTPSKYAHHRRNASVQTPHPDSFYNKTSQDDVKSSKSNTKTQNLPQSNINKDNNEQKFLTSNNTVKAGELKENVCVSTTSNENSFANLSAPAMISTSCTLTDTNFGLDFDCNLNRTMPNHSTSYVPNNNFFYNKNDAFNPVKNTIYSTSSITTAHDFNSLSLYPCAMEKYPTKNKPEFTHVDDNLMKINSSRLTYDIDLAWPHKSFDFVNCTTNSNTFSKENIFTTAAAPFTTSYNPFNPDFHMSLSTSNKKDTSSKTSSAYTDTISNFYSQPSNFWPDEMPFYNNNNISSNKTLSSSKQQMYVPSEQTQITSNVKPSHSKQCDTKGIIEHVSDINKSTSHISSNQVTEKYSKKSPSKAHINWMTSETRSVQNNNIQCNTSHANLKESSKPSYGQTNQELLKKLDHNDSNYFPIHVNNLPMQISQEEFHMWPSSRPQGTTEITMEPPPINLPTLVGDLALGPHDKKKIDHLNRVGMPNAELANNFLSVTQIMNRSSESMASRYQGTNADGSIKVIPTKQSNIHYINDHNRKNSATRIDTNVVQPCYVFDNPKSNTFENMNQFSTAKSKINKSSEKISKSNKNNYSAESLIRGVSQKVDNAPSKFMMSTQKYSNFNSSSDGSIAQVSHFPPIIDYSDNAYSSQQLGTSLYSSTTNTISNSFYTNFMPTSSNLMSSNYTSGNFSGEYIDYNQPAECNYTNQKYEEFKMRNNPLTFTHDKVPSLNYRNTRRESATKHKLECSKKDKKYTSKKSKANVEVEDWSDTSHLFWQNRTPTKKPVNLVPDEFTYPNYPSNQIPTQYQTEFYNSHLMPSNVQTMSNNIDRSVSSFPGTSRANFNLSTIFPEITMVS